MKAKNKSIDGKASTFSSIFRSFGAAHPPYQLFSDFCTLAAASISNSMHDFQSAATVERREKEYAECAARYSTAELENMGNMLGSIRLAIEDNPEQDFLGRTYQELEIANKGAGQFFTPYHIGTMIARSTLEDTAERLKDKPYISIQDPCVGGGALLIAAFNEAKIIGINPQTQFLFYGADIDGICLRMAYVQCSLLGMSGHFIHGNSLHLEQWDSFSTPMFYLNAHRFSHKQSAENSATTPIPILTPEYDQMPTRNQQIQQLSLF